MSHHLSEINPLLRYRSRRNYDLVRDGAAEAFQGNQGAAFIVVGFPGFAYPDGLANGVTYYWRIDEVNDTEPNSPWEGPVWSFSIPPKTAYNPDPADAAEQVYPDTKLNWTGGFDSKLHTVYFGDNFDDVNNATGGLPQGTTDSGALQLKVPSEIRIRLTVLWMWTGHKLLPGRRVFLLIHMRFISALIKIL